MKRITNFSLLILAVLLLMSCGKESLEGEFTFSGISENNDVFGYEFSNGSAVEIPSSDIDLSLFDGVELVSHLDNISFLADNRVSYVAYDRYNSTGSRTEEVDYSIKDGILTFDYFDEFQNVDPIRFRVVGSTLELDMYVYSYSWGGIQQGLEKYHENPNFVVGGSQAEQRLGDEEGDRSHVMLYKQIYEMK